MPIDRTGLILSSTRALWGAVTPCLRAVTVEFHKGPIHRRCVFEGSETEVDTELLRVAFTEVISDLPDEALAQGIQEEYLSLRPPAKIPRLMEFVYQRAEEFDIEAARPIRDDGLGNPGD